MSDALSSRAFAQITASPADAEVYSVAAGVNFVIVDLGTAQLNLRAPRCLPTCVIIGLGGNDDNQICVDVMAANEDELAELTAAIERQPVASATLAQILRHNEKASVEQGLLAESLAYSTLQQSGGFKHWLSNARRPAARPQREPLLHIERDDTELTLTLNRPGAHNAYNAALKDALCEALYLAHADSTIRQVCLRGNGASFSAGGDLSEFGSVEDAGTAHLSRTTRTAAGLLSTLNCATRAWVHGACIGAGIELPAFTQHISARPDTFFQLPEVAMGLIPGAGGTVSVLNRIGRQRTAYMALSNRRIDAQTALAWGLIDAVIQ